MVLFIRLFLFLCAIFTAVPAFAEGVEPSLPPALENLRGEGAQLHYLGADGGLDGWVAIQKGQKQYFYVTPDGAAFVSGVLFNKDGKMVTIRQLQALQQEEGSDVLGVLAADAPLMETPKQPERKEFKTPAEQMYQMVEGANWVPLGNPDAPYIYSFVDPQCPHCHDFIQGLRNSYIENGLLQVRIVPVGFQPESQLQAAFLIAAPDGQERFYKHLDGDESALPVNAEINRQGVQRNMSVMQTWDFKVTPLSVYRAKDGSIKIVQGKAKDIGKILSDLQ